VEFVAWLVAEVALSVACLAWAVSWAGYHALGDLAALELKLEILEHEVLGHVEFQTETPDEPAGTEQASHQQTEEFAVSQLTEEWTGEYWAELWLAWQQLEELVDAGQTEESVAWCWTEGFVALDWIVELVASAAGQLWFETGGWFASVGVGFEEYSAQKLACLVEWCPWTEGPSDLTGQLVFFPAVLAAEWTWVVEVGSWPGWWIQTWQQ